MPTAPILAVPVLAASAMREIERALDVALDILVPLAVIAAIVIAGIAAWRLLTSGRATTVGRPSAVTDDTSSRAVLDRRLAAGEVSIEEYHRIGDVLGQSF